MMVGAFFSFLGYLPSYCRRYTQSYFSSWVYRLTSVSLYPHFSLVVGICISASLYPRFSFVVGICIAFCFPIPTLFSCCGYLFDICRRYTQSCSLLWVYSLFSSLLYPKLYLLLGIIDAFLFIIPNKAICQTTLLQSYFRFAFIS